MTLNRKIEIERLAEAYEQARRRLLTLELPTTPIKTLAVALAEENEARRELERAMYSE